MRNEKSATIISISVSALILALMLTGYAFRTSLLSGIHIEDLSEEEFFTNTVSKEYTVEFDSPYAFKDEDFNFVIEDPSIIDIEADYVSYDRYYRFFFTIKGLKEGTTSFYMETKNKKVKSDTVIITVKSK